MYPIKMNLQLFATQTTALNAAGNSTEAEIKTYYENRLVDYAEPELVHDQFGDSYPIPARGGKTIEFRRFSPLSKALTPITEGVTPSGNKLNVDTVTASIDQYGDFVELSDLLDMTAVDPVVEQTTKLLASQAGRTLDTITREVLCGGTQVLYAPYVNGSTVTEVEERDELSASCKLTPDLIFKAAAQLKAMNAKPVDDSFVAIIHPYAAYDLMRSDEWIEVHKYEPAHIYFGEIGRIGGVRFVETTEAKIIAPAAIVGSANKLTLKTALDATGSTTIAVKEAISATDATAANAAIGSGVTIYVGGKQATMTAVTAGAAGSATLTVSSAVKSVAADSLICGGGAGADGSAVFCTLLLGANAYGRTEIEGGGLTSIIKQRGSSGTADPLDQRSTVGWKATKGTERLVEEYMLRIESGCSYSATATSN
ncbi:MAG: N4-gp56 family major capsid protein [Clostridia bacterium]|nr:N4-gp56 family major capsid protein [Clostridia bacterium]